MNDDSQRGYNSRIITSLKIVFTFLDYLIFLNVFQSHGSVTVRLGVIIFGTGALIYYLMELLRFAELAGSGKSPCFHPAIGLNDCLAIIFTTLQAIMIFAYPRLNIHAHKLLNR